MEILINQITGGKISRKKSDKIPSNRKIICILPKQTSAYIQSEVCSRANKILETKMYY
jgi:hypothetical protein